jgi:DNA-binding transcriptional regulator YhcF (GntR family)
MKGSLTEFEGFTPIIDAVVQEVGLMTAIVFGVIYRHCQMNKHVCNASQTTLAEKLGMRRETVNRHIAKLVKLGYIEEVETSGRTITYQDTGKANLLVKVIGGLTENLTCDLKSQDCDLKSQETVIKSHTKILLEETSEETKKSSAKPALSPVKAPPIPVSKPIKEKPIPKENNNYAMAQALADVSGMNFVVNKGRLFKNAGILVKVPGITPDLIRRDYGEGGDWYRYDWRGKQGEKPTPEAVRATLGNLSNNGKGSRQPLLEKQTPEQIREIAELLRKGKENK